MLARRRRETRVQRVETALDALEPRVEAIVEGVEGDGHTLDGDREGAHAVSRRREGGAGGDTARGARLGAGVLAGKVLAADALGAVEPPLRAADEGRWAAERGHEGHDLGGGHGSTDQQPAVGCAGSQRGTL